MIKKSLTLIVTSSLISAGLLYLGFTVLSQYTPAHASSLKALVAETGLAKSAAPVSSSDDSLSSKESGSEKTEDASSSSQSVSSSSTTVFSSGSQPSTGTASNTNNPITGVTIAELLKNLGLHDEILVTLTGIATSLDSERFLLNDGTGQIIVEVEDDQLVQLPDINGLSVTVTGKFEASSSSSSGPELKAFSLTAMGQTFVFSDDVNDDDMDDDMDDSSDDDLNDDNSGSGSDDDLSDDHSGSGSDDDLSDDHSGSGSDDDLGDDNSGSGSSDSSWGEIDD